MNLNNFSITKKNTGFTLIELVVVMVILGIIAVTVAPKFIDLSSEATIKISESLQGTINSAASMVYLKSIIHGKQDSANNTLDIGAVTIDIAYGYPTGTAEGIVKALAIDNDDWSNGDKDGQWHSRPSTVPNAWIFWPGHLANDAWTEQCFLRYNESIAANTKPVIQSEFSGC